MEVYFFSGTQDQIDTKLILMKEELPVAKDFNLNQLYLPHTKQSNQYQTTHGMV